MHGHSCAQNEQIDETFPSKMYLWLSYVIIELDTCIYLYRVGKKYTPMKPYHLFVISFSPFTQDILNIPWKLSFGA